MSAALTYPNHGTNSVTSSPRGSLEYKSRISKKGNLKKSSCVETRSVDYGFSLETLEMTDLSKPSSYPFLHHEQEDENEGDRITEARQNQPALQTHNECFMLYTPDEEERVIKIFDRRLVLFVALLYMLSFLDRSSMYCFAECFIDC